MKNRIVRFEIGCDDTTKTRTFYESLFDWKITQSGPGLTIDTGELPAGGITSLGHEPRHYTLFYVEVEDIAASIALLRAAELPAQAPPSASRLPGTCPLPRSCR